VGEKRARRETIPLIRLHIVVEGQTEEGFVNEVLAPELGQFGIFADAHSITTRRDRLRVFRGGWDSYGKLANDVIFWMKQDQNTDAWFTTMVDLYGLPTDFPGHGECQKISEPRRKVECLQAHFARDIKNRMENDTVSQRFLPYIQLHEFEALLFADPSKFGSEFPDQDAAVADLTAIRRQYPNPEDIDEGQTTAPSKRILKSLPDYSKRVAGILVAKHIGLPTLRRECPHFGNWIDAIVKLASPAGMN